MSNSPKAGVVVDRSTRPQGALGTIVLLNSLGTTVAMWDEVVPVLAESFDVVRFDQRGHGDAPAGGATAELDDLVDDCFGVVDEIGAARVHLAGISIGGMAAIRAASRAPERVASLAVLCSAAVLDQQSWIERAALVRREGLEPLVAPVMGRWFSPEFRSGRPEVVDASAAMLRSIDPEGYAIGCDVLASADVRADLARVAAPTLVVGGAEDPATPPHEQRFLAGAIRNSRVEILPGVGHLAPVAAPAEVGMLVVANAMDVAAVSTNAAGEHRVDGE